MTRDPGTIGIANDAKIAQAAAVLDRQSTLLRELHSFASAQAKTAAALVQAVKYAEDGLIDVSDIREYATKLKAEGNVKLSSIDDFFRLEPGRLLEGPSAPAAAQLDPLTRALRDLSTSLPSVS